MWLDGRDAGAGLCTRTHIQIGLTELSLTPFSDIRRDPARLVADLSVLRNPPSSVLESRLLLRKSGQTVTF